MKGLLLLVGGLFLSSLVGCSGLNAPADPGVRDTPTPFPVARSESSRIAIVPSQRLLSEQAGSINTFAVSMYKQLGSMPGNLFFSPYSITAALGMTEAGARGQTAVQIRKALSVTLPGEDFHASINGLDLSLMGHAQATAGITLNVVNSTWARTGWDFRVQYLDLLSRYYGAGVNLLDFEYEPEPSRIIINTWVADQTNQRITDLIPQGVITDKTVLVLTNAIYFLGNWRYRFDAAQTRNERFTRLDRSTVFAPLMQLGENGKTVNMKYARVGTNRAIDLPYKGDRLCMTIVLPDSGTFPAFESGIDIQQLNALIQALDTTKLPPVRLPKFSFTSGSVSLVPAFKNLGMVDAFDDAAADFSGIDGTRWLVIGDIVHKAFVAVDENGTQAAAATAVVIGPTSVQEPKMFVANRPFVYLIRDRGTGVILFMGRILDPTQEK